VDVDGSASASLSGAAAAAPPAGAPEEIKSQSEERHGLAVENLRITRPRKIGTVSDVISVPNIV
jgi:hypothetical protein